MPLPSAPPAYGEIANTTSEPPASKPESQEAEATSSSAIFENETAAPHLPRFPKHPNLPPPPYQPSITEVDETAAASTRINGRSGTRARRHHRRRSDAGSAAIVAGSIMNDLFTRRRDPQQQSSGGTSDSSAVGIAAIACIVCNVFGCLFTGVYLLAKSCKNSGQFRLGYFLAGLWCLIVLPALTITLAILYLQHNPNFF
ncbi:unnamed protein product, partial [Mesorhabditis spiculigera]